MPNLDPLLPLWFFLIILIALLAYSIDKFWPLRSNLTTTKCVLRAFKFLIPFLFIASLMQSFFQSSLNTTTFLAELFVQSFYVFSFIIVLGLPFLAVSQRTGKGSVIGLVTLTFLLVVGWLAITTLTTNYRTQVWFWSSLAYFGSYSILTAAIFGFAAAIPFHNEKKT